MRNLSITTLLIIIVLHTNALSQPFEFASDVVWGLQTSKIADDRLKSSKLEDAVTMMKDLLVYSNEIGQANFFLQKHIQSKDTLISQPAFLLSNLYSEIYQNNQNLVAFIEKTLNNLEETSDHEGTWSRKLSEITARNEELWRKIPVAVIGVTYALIDYKRTRDGKLYCLRITKSQVEQLRKKITRAFGKQISEGPKAGQFPLDASAALLYEFLKGGWLPSDSN